MQSTLALARQSKDQKQMINSLIMLGNLFSDQADYATADRYLQHAMTLAETKGDVLATTLCLIDLGCNAQTQHHHQAALGYLERALTLARSIQSRRYIAHATSILALVSQQQGNLDRALDYITQAVAIDREIEERFGLAHDLVTCGIIQLDLQAVEAARGTLLESLQIAQALGGAPILLYALLGFARLHLYRGQTEQAAELCGLISAHPALTPEMQQMDLAKLMAAVAAVLPPAVLTVAQVRGQHLDINATVTGLLAYRE